MKKSYYTNIPHHTYKLFVYQMQGQTKLFHITYFNVHFNLHLQVANFPFFPVFVGFVVSTEILTSMNYVVEK